MEMAALARKAPDFWSEFYADRFQQATSMDRLFAWAKLVGLIKHFLTLEGWEKLRSLDRTKKELLMVHH